MTVSLPDKLRQFSVHVALVLDLPGTAQTLEDAATELDRLTLLEHDVNAALTQADSAYQADTQPTAMIQGAAIARIRRAVGAAPCP